MTAGWNGRRPAPSEAAPLATRLCGVPRDRVGTPGGAPVQCWLALSFVTCLLAAQAAAHLAAEAMRYRQLARRVNKTLRTSA